jgi:metal-responsive CopG/Arc/MetJ family transcriptional regulator
MKAKTSVTLSQEILALIDQHIEEDSSRSAFIELAVKAYLELIRRNRRDQSDLEIINRLSDELNQEASDVLRYQAEL